MNYSMTPDGTPIDPVMFAINWSTLFEMLVLVVVLAFLVERVLALVFESAWFLEIHKKRKAIGKGTYKPFIAFGVAATVCWLWQIDLPAVLMSNNRVSVAGILLTGALVAGGSKASIALFRDVLGVYSGPYKEYLESKHKPTNDGQ